MDPDLKMVGGGGTSGILVSEMRAWSWESLEHGGIKPWSCSVANPVSYPF